MAEHLTKKEFLELLGMRQTAFKYVQFPVEVLNKIEYLYHFVKINYMNMFLFRSIVVKFGVEIIIELIENHRINSIFHLLKIMKTVKNTLREYVEVSQEKYPFVPLNRIYVFFSEFEKRNMNIQEQLNFLEFITENNKILLTDKVVCDAIDINNIFNMYDEMLMEKLNKKNKLF